MSGNSDGARIECWFVGRLGQNPERKVSAAGRNWLKLNVVVGHGDQAQWLQVAIFNNVDELAGSLAKGDRAVIEGALTLRTWQAADGTNRAGLSIAAYRVVPVGLIGPKRPRQQSSNRKRPSNSDRSGDDRPFDDAIPF